MSMEQDLRLLRQCVALATDNVACGGGPFAAMVVRDDGEILAQSGNCVTSQSDPTAHAEVQALRLAAATAGRPHLSDCTLYASCEPCPMCLAAAMWAHIPRIVHAATHEQAARAGFDDSVIARALYGQAAPVNMPTGRLFHLPIPESAAPFDAWLAKADRVPY
jgi:guanine deaminase